MPSIAGLKDRSREGYGLAVSNNSRSQGIVRIEREAMTLWEAKVITAIQPTSCRTRLARKILGNSKIPKMN